MARRSKSAQIDGTCLIGTKRVTFTAVRAVLNSLPEEMRCKLRPGQFRYAMQSAQDSNVLFVIVDNVGFNPKSMKLDYTRDCHYRDKEICESQSASG